MTANAPEQPKPIDKDSAEKLAKILGQMGATEEGQRASAAARAVELLKRRPDIAQDIAANLSRFTGGEGQPSYDELERTLSDALDANEKFVVNETALHDELKWAQDEVERLRNKYEPLNPRQIYTRGMPTRQSTENRFDPIFLPVICVFIVAGVLISKDLSSTSSRSNNIQSAPSGAMGSMKENDSDALRHRYNSFSEPKRQSIPAPDHLGSATQQQNALPAPM